MKEVEGRICTSPPAWVKYIDPKDFYLQLLASDATKDYQLDRNTVSRSVSELAEKLATQTRISEESETIKKAESSMVRCLRLNDRRPLDCWKEVADFKNEVARLEKSFVGKVVGDI